METSRIQSHSGNNGKNINEENEDGESITEKRKILDPDAIGSDTRSSGHDTIAATTTTTTTLVPFDSTGRPSLFVTTALAHLKEAIDIIPSEKKKDFLHAMRCAPHLIQTESHPIKFLRCEEFNPWRAARRLVLYWEYRRWLFKERWLLPFGDDTEEDGNAVSSSRDADSALNEKDAHLLRSGWLAFVCPRRSTDEKRYDGGGGGGGGGRYAIIDHGRYMGHTVDSFVRVVFYLYTMASDEAAQTVGVSSIRLLSSTEYGGETPLSMDLFRSAVTSYTMIRDALPVRMNGAYFLKDNGDGAGGRRGDLLNLFLNRIGRSVVSLLSPDTPVLFAVPNKGAAADALRPHGFPVDALPESHGGTWTYDRLFEWKRRAKQHDPSSGDTRIPVPWLSDRAPDNSVAVGAAAATATATTSMIQNSDGYDGTNPRTKQISAFHTRMAYHKREQKLKETKQRAEDLRLENTRLRSENQLLHSLVQQATDIIALIGTMDDSDHELDAVVAAATAAAAAGGTTTSHSLPPGPFP